ncbi:MAG: hypothetical protein H6822_30295 [Planctomycetaceae bacterium]|nr:hypothetical protein [Planctomycetaceae bacterium]
MTTNPITAWQTRFSKAADADRLNLLREHLRNLGLPDEPELLLKGTLVEEDLFFDYTEDELSVWFDDSRSPFYLYVDVSDRDESLND